MDTYLFYGVILPERAQLTLQNAHNFTHLSSGVSGSIQISILNNQLAVWVTSEGHEWNIFDLRNLVKTFVQNQIAMVGYLMGYAYDLEISRVLHPGRGVDFVFGIDIPCLASRNAGMDIAVALALLEKKSFGPNGVFLNRCFTDLCFAMRHADDTGFYCYRAIESLFHHCAAAHGIEKSPKSARWSKFREVASCDEKILYSIKDAADPLRHGEAAPLTDSSRESLLMSTWDVVDGYLASLPT
ncbi:hypothetical protein T3H00_18675 [Pseudomonas fluorescens]|uniref:hypothetical protein n=1 Tax=Pseudomonas fluorescens TaxID=294 RepID=UPI002ACA6593|nr:hypothetical protein [Pseudomonas fluorescens]MDZ5434681.1 hypothetical protein [Pseudomonas fluorescens]